MKWFYWLFLFASLSFSSVSFASGKYPSNWLEDTIFNKLYLNALEQAKLKGKVGDWLDGLSVTASPSEIIEFDGEKWDYISGCKPHSCPSHGIDILYNQRTKKLYGLVKNDFSLHFIGSPNLQIRQKLVSQVRYW